MGYSGAAAIHACLLVWIGPSSGELDFVSLIAILSTSCIATVPLINWSRTLRKLGSKDHSDSGARTIIIYWAFLVTVGLLATLVRDWGSFEAWVYSSAKSTTCSPTGHVLNNTIGQESFTSIFQVDVEWINENDCLDPCRGDSFFQPTAIFRSQSDLQALSQKEIRQSIGDLSGKPSPSMYYLYGSFGTILGAFLLSQGIWAACFGRRNPRQCRSLIYVFIKNVNLPFSFRCPRAGSGSQRTGRWKRQAAKLVALIAYLWAVVSSGLCVLLFITNIVVFETLLTHFPQSESATHVGAWTPWVTTALVLLAALIAKYHDLLVSSISASAKETRQKFFARFGHRTAMVGNDRSRLLGPASSTPTNPATLKWALAPLRFVDERFLSFICLVREEWVLLKKFWRDPDERVDSA